MSVLSSHRTATVLALMRSAATAQAIAEGLRDWPHLRLQVRVAETLEHAPEDLEAAPDVLLVELDPEDRAEVAALEHLLRRHHPQPPAVVASPPPSVEAMRALMRLGVVDVVTPPFPRQDLTAALDAAAAKLPPPPGGEGRRRHGRCISFLKSCGGAGATTVAVNAAEYLARRSRQADAVLLLDLDLQFGDAALQLDLAPQINALDLLSEPSRLDVEMLRSAVIGHRSGLDMIAAPPDVVPLDAVTPEAAEALVTLAADTYRTVLIDLPAVWTPWSREVLAASDAIVLVTPLTVPAVRHAVRQIQTLKDEGLEAIPVLPVAARENPGLLRRNPVVRDAEKALEREIRHVIPSRYPAVAAALNAGRTLNEAGAAAPVRRAIARLADALAPAAAKRTAKAES